MISITMKRTISARESKLLESTRFWRFVIYIKLSDFVYFNIPVICQQDKARQDSHNFRLLTALDFRIIRIAITYLIREFKININICIGKISDILRENTSKNSVDSILLQKQSKYLCRLESLSWNKLEPEDEQNERVRRSASNLNKRNGLNAHPSYGYLRSWRTWKDFAFVDDTRVKECALFCVLWTHGFITYIIKLKLKESALKNMQDHIYEAIRNRYIEKFILLLSRSKIPRSSLNS